MTSPETPCPALYYLENISVEAFEGRRWSTVILEPSETAPEVLEAAKASSTLVLAYVNAGYAEDWRPYWDTVLSAGIVHGETMYEGEYYVEIWSSLWKSIVANQAVRFVEMGYQGVYLDNIDAIESLSSVGWAESANLTRAVITLVCEVKNRILEANPDAKLFINIGGATRLLYHKDLLSCIDGVLREELWNAWSPEGPVPQGPEETSRALRALEYAEHQGITVIVVDPVAGKTQARELCRDAWSHGFTPSPQPASHPDYDAPPPPDWCPCKG